MAGTAHVTRKKVISMMAEDTEGTLKTPATAASCSTTIYDDAGFQADINIYDRAPAKAKFSTLPGLLGARIGRITYKFEIAGAGSTATTVPKWMTYGAVPCGWQQVAEGDLKQITHGSPTVADPIPGEIFTNASDSVTFIKYLTSDTVSLFYDPDGDMGAEEWIGSVSGATFTASGTAANTSAVVIRPDSTVTSHTGYLYNPYSDTKSTTEQIIGGRGGWRITCGGVGEPIFMECEVLGIIPAAGVTDETTPTPLVYDDYAGLAFIDASFSMESDAASTGMPAADITLTSFSIDSGTTYEPRPSANASTGAISALHTNRAITGNFDPELVTIAEHDIWGDVTGGTHNAMSTSLGSATGDKIDIYAGHVKYRGYGSADRTGIRTLDMPFGVHRVGTNEDWDVIIVTS